MGSVKSLLAPSGVPRISFFWEGEGGINFTRIIYLPGWEPVALAVLSL